MGDTFSKTKDHLDLQPTYLLIQFMTAEEKGLKDVKITDLKYQYKNKFQEIIPYEEKIKVSFRMKFNTAEIAALIWPIKNQIRIQQLICHLKASTDSQLEEFMFINVKQLTLKYFNNKIIEDQNFVKLSNQIDVSVYQPQKVLQIIYTPKSLWKRIKNRVKNGIKKAPMALLSLLPKLAQKILGFFGIETGWKGLIINFLPKQSILQYFFMGLSLFFPFLASITKFLVKRFL